MQESLEDVPAKLLRAPQPSGHAVGLTFLQIGAASPQRSSAKPHCLLPPRWLSLLQEFAVVVRNTFIHSGPRVLSTGREEWTFFPVADYQRILTSPALQLTALDIAS